MDITFVRQWSDLPEPLRSALQNANLFYTESYRQFKDGPCKEFVYLFTSDFIIPALLTKKSIFSYADFCSEPFSLTGSSSEEMEKNFLAEAVRCLKDHFKIMWVRQTPVTALFRASPPGSPQIPFGSYIIDLSKTEEEIWAAFSSKYRQYGRQCREAGGVVKAGGVELLEDFYPLLVASMSRAEAVIESKDFYRKMLSHLPLNSKIFVAYKDQHAEAAVLLLFNRRMSYTFYGGISASPHKGSNILLYWEAIRWMKSVGVRSFSFVGCRISVDKGSKYEGIQTFKQRFGGELRQGFMFKTIHDPWRMKAYTFAQTIRMALRGRTYPGDIVDQEIHKWPGLQS